MGQNLRQWDHPFFTHFAPYSTSKRGGSEDAKEPFIVRSQAAGALLPFFLSNGVPGYSKEENVGWEGYSEADSDHRDINDINIDCPLMICYIYSYWTLPFIVDLPMKNGEFQ